MIKHLVAILCKGDEGFEYTGTGFFFGDSFHVITCKHNLEDDNDLSCKEGDEVFLRYEEETIKGKLSKIFEDIAIIVIDDNKERPFFPYSSMRCIKQEMIPNHIKCMCVGFENGIKEERHNNAFPECTGQLDGRLVLHSANEIKKGFSGAPLLSIDNCLLGMIYSYDTITDGKAINVANAIPIERIYELMDDDEHRDIPVYTVSPSCEKSNHRDEGTKEKSPKPKLVKIPLNMIPPAEKKLIGREGDIKSIRDILKQNNIVIIHADGGVGKTAVALKIVDQIKREIIATSSPYEHVAWITSTGNLKTDLIEINVPSVINEQSIEKKFEKAKEFLQTTSTFLVIDNMDDCPTTEDANILNTISGWTKILITSRAEISDFCMYNLETLNLDSAIILFYRHYKNMHEPATIEQIMEQQDFLYAKNIVEGAKRNSLFIELIGCMAYADHWNLQDLWGKLEKDVFSQNSKYKIHTKHGNDEKLLEQIKKLYEISDLSECQKEVLTFMTLFPAECSIFFDVFEWAGFEDDTADNLGLLQKRGWIERSEEGYLIHTMVWGSIKLQQKKTVFDEERYENLINKLCDILQYIPGNLEYTKKHERIIVLETICSLLDDIGSRKIITAHLHNNLASMLFMQGSFVKGVEYCKKALSIYRSILGENHTETASTYSNIANAYYFLDNYEEAFKYYSKALSIFQNVRAMCLVNEAKVYINLAIMHRNREEYIEAEALAGQALSFFQNIIGDESPNTMMAYNVMASVYAAQKKNDKAEEYYRKAQSIQKKIQIDNQPSSAIVYRNQADMYFMQHNYDKALKLYEKALEILEKYQGYDHQDTAMTYISIAKVYLAKERYNEAQDYYQKAIPFYEKGKDEQGLASLYNSCAQVYTKQHNYEEAIKYYKKDMDITKEILGEDHPDIAKTYNCIAMVLYLEEKYDAAIKNYLKALKIDETRLGKDHPDTTIQYYNLALTYNKQKNYKDALQYYLKFLVNYEKQLGEENSEIAVVYKKVANLYDILGNSEMASMYYKKYQVASEKVLDEKSSEDTSDE